MAKTIRKRNKLGQFIKASPPWTDKFSKLAPIALVLILGTVFLNIPITNAYFNDTENSMGNTFTAGTLDFHLNPSTDFTPLPLGKGETTSTLIALVNDGSLSFQYTASITAVTGDSDLCNYLTLQVDLNGDSVYSDSISGFSAAAGNYVDPSAWNFVVTLPSGADDSLQDKTCNFKLTFSGWQEDLLPTQGFNATKQISVAISSGNWTIAPPAPTVPDMVLNEILPHPDSSAIYPANKEFVELYNNASTSIDVVGWKISEISGSSESFHTIVASSTGASQMEPYGGSTVINSGQPIAIMFYGSASYLNDGGDTVRLYDSLGVLQDTFTYTSSSEGKSIARIPDGTGDWIDPIPTPGEPNEMGEILSPSPIFIADSSTGDFSVITTTPEVITDISPENNPEPAPILEPAADPVISEPELTPATAPEQIIEPDLIVSDLAPALEPTPIEPAVVEPPTTE